MAPRRSRPRAAFQDQRVLARSYLCPDAPPPAFEDHCEHLMTRFGGTGWTAVDRAVRVLLLASVGHSARWLSKTIHRLTPSVESWDDLAEMLGEVSVFCATMTVLAALGMPRVEQNDSNRRARRLCVAAATLRLLRAAAQLYSCELANLMGMVVGSGPGMVSPGPVIAEAWRRFDVGTSPPTHPGNGITEADVERSAVYRYLLQATGPTEGTAGGRPLGPGPRVLLTVGVLEFFPAVNELSPFARGCLYEMPAWSQRDPVEQLADVPWLRPDMEQVRGFLRLDPDSVRERVRKNESRYGRIWQQYLDAQSRLGGEP